MKKSVKNNSPVKKGKYYSIKTFGCYTNEVDSNLIAGVFNLFGFEELKVPSLKNEVLEIKYTLENADVFVVNSCSVRQKSEDKVYGLGKVLKHYEKKKAKVFLTGCIVGSALGDRKRFSLNQLKQKTGSYDGYFAPSDINSLVMLLKEFKLIDKDLGMKIVDRERIKKRQIDKKHAYVNISYGCDNFCSYCVVPYSRGCEISRLEKDILDEIKCLVKNGVSEVTLCGQNVNSWGLTKEEKFKVRSLSSKKEKLPFANLLKDVHKILGVEKIDFISSNPFDFTQDLVETLKLPKISNYIHIAVQSGNNDILKAMNRRHTVEEFVDLIRRIRKVKPGVEIGTDIIVGFPGETRKQFMDTVNLVKKIGFSVAFISMYSPRKGTNSQMNMKDSVSQKEKKWRHMYLSKVWKSSKEKLNGKKKERIQR